MSRYLRLLVGAIAIGACSSTTSQPVADFTPADMLDMGVDMFGVVADIPHRQYLGETIAAGNNQFPPTGLSQHGYGACCCIMAACAIMRCKSPIAGGLPTTATP